MFLAPAQTSIAIAIPDTNTDRRADDENSLEQAITEVFAETSDQSSETVADFEMLAALPDDFAVEGWKALMRLP